MSATAARALLALVLLVTAVGTALWIGGVLRPVPTLPPATVRGVSRQDGLLAVALDAGREAPIDRTGESVLQFARRIATGRLSAPAAIAFDVRSDGHPLMRLVYDPGVLAAGAVSGGDGDHLLGLAGAGTRWPARDDPALFAYCGRMETMTKPFCKRARGR